jgi:type IV secretion system protein VirB1
MTWADQLPACAPTVHPFTMHQVVMVESGGNPLAIRVNGLTVQPHPHTTAEAVADARYWIGRGYRVDLGLVQVDSANLPALHLTIERVLGTDPITVCANLEAGAEILTANYGRAVQQYQLGQPALAAALSAYNTGTFTGGWANGYVARYYVIPAVALPRPRLPAIMIARAVVNRPAADFEVW